MAYEPYTPNTDLEVNWQLCSLQGSSALPLRLLQQQFWGTPGGGEAECRMLSPDVPEIMDHGSMDQLGYKSVWNFRYAAVP